MSLIYSQQSLTASNLNVIRNQLVQTANEVLNFLNKKLLNKQGICGTKCIEIDEIQQASVKIIENNKIYAIDKILEPLLSELNTETTFYENRNGFKSSELLECKEFSNNVKPVFLNKVNLFNGNKKLYNFQQYRGFKTERTQKREADIYGSRFSLKNLIEDNSAKHEDSDLASKLFKKNSRFENWVNSQEQNLNKPKPENDKVMQAFAEGYMAHEKLSGVRAKKMSVKNFFEAFRSFISFTITVLAIFILYSFYKTMNPSETAFKPNETNQSNMTKLGAIFSTGVSEIKPEEAIIKFDDVKGVPEAKLELQEVVDYLKDPEKYTRLGGRLPKGVLLVGPPGTGKTLLAKAVAGEAGVPFFQCSGSEFDEMFVGTGAKKIRNLFSSARARKPCVIFIDEIDSVGGKRSSSSLHPYANQTINQMLAEMDGFQNNEGVIVLGATNRRESLDKALLRPGRFDVEVRVDPPDFKGRVEILNLYLKKVVHSSDIDLNSIARITVGFTGADLSNIVNQAALKAAQDNDTEVRMKHIEWAKDRIGMGAAKLSRIPDEKTNRATAYHESGHTIVAFFTKEAYPLHKVTMIPRGMSLGSTSYSLEEKDMYSKTKQKLLAEIDTLMGGRAAEEFTFGKENIGTGISNDLERATNIATWMVKKLSMSDKVGLRVYKEQKGELGEVESEKLSAETKELLDTEINRILNESYERAKNIIKEHSSEFKLLAETLLIHETLDANEIKYICENNKKPPHLVVKEKNMPKIVANDTTNKAVF